MTNLYLFIKAIHIISFTAWMAGMFYLPRIFVYHSEKKLDKNTHEKFLIMENKLIKIIMTPAMLATWFFGSALLLINNNIELWVLLKIFFVILMSGCHGFFIKCYKDFYNKKNRYNDKFFRIINEAPTFLLVVIVFLVVFKPSF